MNRLDELIANAADGLLTETERLELETLLVADPGQAEKWAELLKIEAGLRSTRVRFLFSETVPQAIRAEREQRMAQDVLRQIRLHPVPVTNPRAAWYVTFANGFRLSRPAFAFLSGALAVLLASGLLWFNWEKPEPDMVVEQAKNLEVRRGWWWRSVYAGEQMNSRRSLRTGTGGSARLRFLSDSTSVDLDEQTQANLAEHSSGKKWSIGRGRLQVHAAHQPPGHPLRLRTTQGQAEVVGTTFSLSARPTTSWLRVDEGSVRWANAADDKPLLVTTGHFVAAGHGPIELLSVTDPETLRIPFALDPRRSFHDGDGAWNTDGSALVQSKVSHVPMTNAIWGTPESPGSAYIIEARTPESIEIRCDIEVQRTIRDEVARWIWPQNFGLRFYLGRYDFQLNAEGGAVGETALLKFGGSSPDISDAPFVIHGQTHAPLTVAGVGFYHFRLQLWRQPNGHCRTLGKVWTGSAEPNEWPIHAEFDRYEPLTQVGMQTVSCAARFSRFNLFLIE